MLSRAPEDWFRQALSPTASVRDRIVAFHIYGMCVQAKGADDALAEQSTWSAKSMPASVPGVGASEWQGLRKLVDVSPERIREIRKVQAYCGNAVDFNYPAQARQLPTRAYEYADLVLTNHPASRRVPLITTALSSPLVHDLEVRLWAEHDLRDVLQRRDGLTMLQSWHAVGWLLQQVLGDSEQVHLYWQLQCAWLGLCRSVGLLSEDDQRRAEQVAARALTDLQRQDWPRLIFKRL